jgi:hypothetical protein
MFFCLSNYNELKITFNEINPTIHYLQYKFLAITQTQLKTIKGIWLFIPTLELVHSTYARGAKQYEQETQHSARCSGFTTQVS